MTELESNHAYVGNEYFVLRSCPAKQMPSDRPRTPEVEVSEHAESGFLVNVYDGEYLIQLRPHENGYRVDLASKTGLGDAAFLRTYSRDERFRRLLERDFDAIDAEAVFEVLNDHFEEDEYRIAKLKKGIKHYRGRGVYLYVETGETIPTLTDKRDYRDDRWSSESTYRLHVWPTDDQYTEVEDPESGETLEVYRPHSHLEDIRNEETDDHDRDRGPTSVPGVHAPVTQSKIENAPVVHTDIHCPHLDQLQDTVFKPAGEDPPPVAAEGSGELPLRWCLMCAHRFPTPEKLRDRYGP